MKRTISAVILLGITFALLMPSLATAVDNRMIMRGGYGGGGGGPPTTTPTEIVYHTGTANRWAVIIGISDYDGTTNDLWDPDKDALEMAQILEGYGYNYALALNDAGTAENIVLLLDWLITNEDANSEVVFFFSGHGSRVEDGTWDTDIESDGYDECIVSYDLVAVTDSYMASRFSELESTHFAAVYCSCHSGGMFDQPYETRSGALYIAAAEADQYGWDYSTLENTLFFYYFGDQGLLNGPYDNLQDAFWYARPLVIAEQPDSCPIMLDNLGTPFYVK
ncbi:MAG: caspase family protein [Candidatus Thorarchaeota archaeon]